MKIGGEWSRFLFFFKENGQWRKTISHFWRKIYLTSGQTKEFANMQNKCNIKKYPIINPFLYLKKCSRCVRQHANASIHRTFF